MTALRLELGAAASPGAVGTAFSSGSDDEVGVLADVCELIADMGAATYRVEGFGLAWPVDVRTDLPTTLEQLPDLLRLTSGDLGRLEFYEQGLERVVALRVVGDRVHMTCLTLVGEELLGEGDASWQPFRDGLVAL